MGHKALNDIPNWHLVGAFIAVGESACHRACAHIRESLLPFDHPLVDREPELGRKLFHLKLGVLLPERFSNNRLSFGELATPPTTAPAAATVDREDISKAKECERIATVNFRAEVAAR